MSLGGHGRTPRFGNLSAGGHLGSRRDTGGHATNTVRDREAPCLEVEVGTANGSGQLRLLPRELELRGELRGEFHPFGELEPDRVQPALVGGGSFISAAQAGAIPIGGLKPLCK